MCVKPQCKVYQALNGLCFPFFLELFPLLLRAPTWWNPMGVPIRQRTTHRDSSPPPPSDEERLQRSFLFCRWEEPVRMGYEGIHQL